MTDNGKITWAGQMAHICSDMCNADNCDAMWSMVYDGGPAPAILRESTYCAPTLAQLHDLAFGIGHMYIDGDITDPEFTWQWNLVGAMTNRHLAEVHRIYQP